MSFNDKQSIFASTELDYEEIVDIPDGYEKADIHSRRAAPGGHLVLHPRTGHRPFAENDIPSRLGRQFRHADGHPVGRNERLVVSE